MGHENIHSWYKEHATPMPKIPDSTPDVAAMQKAMPGNMNISVYGNMFAPGYAILLSVKQKGMYRIA